ncbi:D-alanyl-D-alanine carboxypeptidase family protein [Paenibacillaceae bacterium WGS1546]|uniref:M15 family metallopeptidase n=1 Tax=Cohnella sp. WGS1546 TaxID=3366810 RepID=UPI00372CF4B6
MSNKRTAIVALIGIAVVGAFWYDGARSNANLSAQPPSASPVTPVPSETSAPPKTPVPSETSGPSEPPVPSTYAPDPGPTAIEAMLSGELPSLTVRNDKAGLAVVTNASSIYVLVNKQRNLPSNYEPEDLVVPDVPFSFTGDSPKKQMRKEAARALEALFRAAEEDGIELKAVSGYRSYATQKSIFESNASKKGEEVANRTSARPGQSEHQTGLAMDISSAGVGYALEESFGKTKEGKWLAKHAPDHGFIIRYPKGEESITGYSYEPWHVRYVGKEIAKDITNKGETLERYFEGVEAVFRDKA